MDSESRLPGRERRLERTVPEISLSIACGDYDRMRALKDGAIGVDGCDVTYLALGPEEIFYRAFGNAEFDVCELSASSYLMGTARGDLPYVAIPVFASRAFRHSAIYINRRSGIRRPEDLKGRLVGVPEYQMTAALWVRGILKDEYGVQPSDLRWRRGGLEQPGRVEKLALALPADIEIAAIEGEDTLNELLVAGEIDALITARTPSSYRNGDGEVVRLFEDVRAVEQDYFRRTGIFPIMHFIGVRKTLVEQHPWLPASLVKAFSLSKQACTPRLTDMAALHETIPWLVQEVEHTKKLMGEDFWPYGLDANIATLEALVEYSFDQGLTAKRLGIGEIFAPGSTHSVKI